MDTWLKARLAIAAGWLGAGAAAACLLVIGPSPAAGFLERLPQAGAYVPGEVLVKFRPGAGAAAQARSIASVGGLAPRPIGRTGLVRLALGAGLDVPGAVAALEQDPNVEYAQPNYVYRALRIPDDPLYPQLWGLENRGQTVPSGSYSPDTGTPDMDLDAELAWDHQTDCSGVVVAVLDSGVNYDHEDLAASMWDGGAAYPKHGYDFVDDDDDPMDTNGHGTHVAGTIGAVGNNGTGTTGVCWRAEIMAVRVLDTLGLGSTATIIQGIDFAVANGARVLNLSLGMETLLDGAFSDAIERARANGVLVVAAAGNGGPDGLGDDNDGLGGDGDPSTAFYPCSFTHDNLVCVAALDQTFALARFSNYGRTSVDVGAPGTNIVSEWPGTEATITDNFASGWTATTTTFGGWTAGPLLLGGSPVDVLFDPSTFPTGLYNNGTDDRVYKLFDFTAADAATLSFFMQIAVQPGDLLTLAIRRGGGDPFDGGVVLDSGSGWSGGIVGPLPYDLAGCTAALCSIGFQLLTDAAGSDQGVGILWFTITALDLNATSYNTIDGTSMASPHVAGLAAMLMAYNPDYTYRDVVGAIGNGGVPVAALSGKTATGRAVNAMGALAYINPPTGVTAVLR